MKKQNLKNLGLRKRAISNLDITGGAQYQNQQQQQQQQHSGTRCLRNTDWCNASAHYSCYGPCAGPLATLGCNG